MRSIIQNIVVICTCLITWDTISTVTQRRTIETNINSNVHLDHSTTFEQPITWQHKPIGYKRPVNVYINGKFVGSYLDSKRFQMEINKELKRCDLVISKAQMDDSGTYYSIDNVTDIYEVHVQNSERNLKVVPVDTIVLAGHEARLNCSTSHYHSIYWQHNPAGTDRLLDVYFGDFGLQDNYASDGRHEIARDTIGQNDLLIKDIQFSDAGTYFCIDNSGLGRKVSAELTVLRSAPSCSSNVSTDGAVAENDCGLEPDYVKFSCHLQFTGNSPPKLEWHQLNNIDDTNTIKSVQDNFTSVSTDVVARASLQMNNSLIVCRVKDFLQKQTDCKCSVPGINLLYIFNTTDSQEMPYSYQKNLSCSANTSQTCDYKWTNKEDVSVLGSSIQLSNSGQYHCIAVCKIRKDTCTVYPLIIEIFSSAEKDKISIGTTLKTILPICFALIILASIAVILVQRKKISYIFRRLNIHLTNKTHDNGEVVTSEPADGKGDRNKNIEQIKLITNDNLEENQESTLQLEVDNHIRQNLITIGPLPKEMLDLILLKTGITLWGKTLPMEYCTDSYDGYKSYIKVVVAYACTALSPVCSDWLKQISQHPRFRRRLRKTIILKQIHTCNYILEKRLAIEHGLLDKLKENGVLSTDEKEEIQESCTSIVAKRFEEYPKETWPQLRSDEQKCMTNRKLLKCLRDKNANDLSQFLKLTKDTCQAHLFNYLTSNGVYFFDFQKVWPLGDKLTQRLSAHQNHLIKIMNPLVEVKQKIEKEFSKDEDVVEIQLSKNSISTESGTSHIPHRHPAVSETDRIQQLLGSALSEASCHTTIHALTEKTRCISNPNHAGSETTSSIQKPDAVASAIIPVSGKTLIDSLCHKQCISLEHKEHIDQLQSLQSKNEELLGLLRNGSMEAFETAVEYFRETQQEQVVGRFLFDYVSEDIPPGAKIEIKGEDGVTGVTWFEKKIYVACVKSNIIQVLSDQNPFNRLEREEIKITEMKQPRDMTALKSYKSIFISDFDDNNSCIWKIQMPGKQISRWPMDGRPLGLSPTSSDDLLVLMQKKKRWYLGIYSSLYVCPLKIISLPTDFKEARHAVQSSKGNFVIAYGTGKWKDNRWSMYFVSEVSKDGNMVRTFNLSLVKSIKNKIWLPSHLALDENDNIFIADKDNHRVIQLHADWSEHQILITKDQHAINSPMSMCYIQGKQLIIGRSGRKWADGSIGELPSLSVFSLQSMISVNSLSVCQI